MTRTPHTEKSHTWRWEAADCGTCQANRQKKKQSRRSKNDGWL